MLIHYDNLLDNFDWKIREPASQKDPVQTRTDSKARKASEIIQDQFQESQSTSNSESSRISISPLTN